SGANGTAGAKGDPGEGVPTGGTTGQVLKKASGTDYDTGWADESGGGGGLDDAGVAALVESESSATRTALDGLYTGGGGGLDDAGVAALVEDDESDTRDALDSLYSGAGVLAQAWQGGWSGVRGYDTGMLVRADDGAGQGTWLALEDVETAPWSVVGVTAGRAHPFNANVTLDVPAGTLTSDLQVLLLSTTNIEQGDPSGWTKRATAGEGSDLELRVYTRTGSTASTTLTSTFRTVAHLWAFRGVGYGSTTPVSTLTSPAVIAGLALIAWTINSTSGNTDMSAAGVVEDETAGWSEQVSSG